MAVKKTELLTKSEFNALLGRYNYSAIELFENVTPELIDFLKRVKRSDNVRVLVISR
jgi:hypothetical protein